MKYPVTTADFLIEDPFSRFSGKDKLKAHPKKFQKNSKKIAKKNSKKIPKKGFRQIFWGCRPPKYLTETPSIKYFRGVDPPNI